MKPDRKPLKKAKNGGAGMSDNYNIAFDVVADDLAELGYIQTEACLFAAQVARRYPEAFVKYLSYLDIQDLLNALERKLKEEGKRND